MHRSCLQLEQSGSQRDKEKSFISKASWYSIEINIHCLTSIILLVTQGHLPAYALNIHLFSSQSCESTFRNARALTGTFSSITNFTVQQFMKKTEKLSLLNNIKASEEANDSCYSLSFPIHHKNKHDDASAPLPSQSTDLMSVMDVEKVIFKAYEFAKKIVSRLPMSRILEQYNLNHINRLSSFVSKHLSKTSKTIDRSTLDETVCNDVDSHSDSSDDDLPTSDDILVDDADAEQEFDSDSTENAGDNVPKMTSNKNKFDGMRIYDDVEPSSVHQYFHININHKKKYIHKQTAAHMLTSNKHHLSFDRLARVQQMNRQN